MTALVVVPTLNEAAHIGRLLSELLPFAIARKARIVVADGGSTDDTCRLVQDFADRHPEICLLHNPDRLQSAGINLAVERFGGSATWLIRIDAHSSYPTDYCNVLLQEAEDTGADSVVVSMQAAGETPFQAIVARAQNSRLGNGGAAHRAGLTGRWVEHGHHALMRLSAFVDVQGYDPKFSHNEDAELDHRLALAGYRIWLTARTHVIYYPRASVQSLVLQYFKFGKGRARNLMKHRLRPAVRQAVMALLLPMILLAVFAGVSPLFAVPALLWALGCLVGGLWIFWSDRSGQDGRSLILRAWDGLLAGYVAGSMHVAWSAGFWAQVISGLSLAGGRSRG